MRQSSTTRGLLIGIAILAFVGCGGASQPQQTTNDVSPDTGAGPDAKLYVNPQEGSLSDSLFSSDTLEALPMAPGLWARVTTVDYQIYSDEMEADIRSTAQLKVEGFNRSRKLFEAKVAGTEGSYLGPCWLTAVADNGSLWVLNCTENMVGVGAANPVATICLDGKGNEIQGLAPIFDPYTETAVLQLDGRRLLEGGRVLDLKSRKWTDIADGPGKGYCSDTLDENTLLVVGRPKGRQNLHAYFFTLNDLKMQLSFPCDCAGESGSSEGIYGTATPGMFTLDNGHKTFKVDLKTWDVDSSQSN